MQRTIFLTRKQDWGHERAGCVQKHHAALTFRAIPRRFSHPWDAADHFSQK